MTPVPVWGIPFAPLTLAETLDAAERLVRAGAPSYLITANLHYVMLTARDPRLAAVNRGAALIVADGMPLVWASRWRPTRLPERVAGSDMVPALCERAAKCGFRIFLLGGAPGIAERAATVARERFPGLQIVGTLAPPFRELTPAEHAELVETVRRANPDLLFVAFGQPKGELWVAEHHRELGVPLTVQVGASLDFLAGRVSRAPRWVQRVGLEWAYRLALEPGRLARRYAANGWFALSMLARDALGFRG